MRFSLMTLLFALTIVAACCFGVFYPNAILSICFKTTAFLIVLFGVLASMVQAGCTRAFWIGFSVFGAAYFLFAFFGEQDIDPGFGRAVRKIGEGTQFVEPHLITTQLLLLANSYVDRIGPPRITPPANVQLPWSIAIGHSIFTLLFALLGGALGVWLYSKRVAALAGEPLARGQIERITA